MKPPAAAPDSDYPVPGDDDHIEQFDGTLADGLDEPETARRPLTISYLTEPPEWRHDGRPFRCGRCGMMVEDGDGKWSVRDQRGDPAYGMPGQFMAVHRVCPGASGFLRRLIGRG